VQAKLYALGQARDREQQRRIVVIYVLRRLSQLGFFGIHG